MALYRKKPVVIQAEQYRPGLEDCFALLWPSGKIFERNFGTREEVQAHFDDMFRNPEEPHTGEPEPSIVPIIKTLEGPHIISDGDWIITGVKGERYPCKPDIFAATYEPADGQEPGR